MPTWPSPSSERLGTPKIPAIRFTRGTYFGASRFTYATACQVARPPLTDRTRSAAPEGFYFQASGRLVCWRDLHPLEWQLASLHQIRTCGIPAYGSHLGYLTANRWFGQG